jgi:hypothetical protein
MIASRRRPTRGGCPGNEALADGPTRPAARALAGLRRPELGRALPIEPAARLLTPGREDSRWPDGLAVGRTARAHPRTQGVSMATQPHRFSPPRWPSAWARSSPGHRYETARRVWNGMIDHGRADRAVPARRDVATALGLRRRARSCRRQVRGGGQRGGDRRGRGRPRHRPSDAMRASTGAAAPCNAGRGHLGRRRDRVTALLGSPPGRSCPRPASPASLSGGVVRRAPPRRHDRRQPVSAEVVSLTGAASRASADEHLTCTGPARRRAATSASSPRSSCACTSSAPRSSSSSSPTRSRTPPVCSPAGATPSPTRRTS